MLNPVTFQAKLWIYSVVCLDEGRGRLIPEQLSSF